MYVTLKQVHTDAIQTDTVRLSNDEVRMKCDEKQELMKTDTKTKTDRQTIQFLDNLMMMIMMMIVLGLAATVVKK
jgi:hypothetical protein